MKQLSTLIEKPAPPPPAGFVMGAPEVDAGAESFARFMQFVRRRGWIVLTAMLVGIGIGVTANLVMKKQYTASADIEIVPDRAGEFRVETTQEVTGDSDDAEKLDTETQVLESRTLALETINSLQLYRNPDFVPPPKGAGAWDVSDPRIRSMLIGAFLGRLNIVRSGHTSILQISVTSEKPQLASVIVNTLIDNYIERSLRDNFRATAKISGWLNSQLTDLKSNLQKSQAQLLAYEKDLGLIGVDPKDSIAISTMDELNKQLANAEVDRMMKEARLRAIKTSSPDVIDAAAASDLSVQVPKQQLAQLRTQYTSMVQTYGPAYPPLKAMKSQIDQLERTIKRAEDAEIERVQKEFDAAQNNEEMLRKQLNDEEQKAYNNGEKGVQFEFARSEYEANRLLYDGLQQRLQEAGIMAGLHSTSIRIIDGADVPVSPSHPRTHVNLAMGTGFGLIVGFALALLLEAMDTNLKTMTDIEQSLQLPLLAAVPSVDAEALLPSHFRELALSRGASSWSRIAEALRGLRTSILLSSPGAPPKVIMITSSWPAEGKSSIATLVAITFALNGSRVLLMDADLRRPWIHLRFKIGKGLGLSSVLSGKSTVGESLVEWPELPNLHIMTSGPVPPLPSELLGSKQMESLVQELRDSYDFVVIDTPPVLAVTDASILGRLADAAILIVRYGSARRQVVQRCIDMLDRSATHLLGVAVNAVNLRSPEYAEYYGRKYYDYYGERNPE